MNNCTKCGNQLNENNKFCISCGHPVEVSNKAETKDEVKADQVKTERSAEPKKEVDINKQRKMKALAIGMAIVLIIGFAAYKIGESMTSKDKIANHFINILTDQNTGELAKILKSSDPRMEITEEGLGPLMEYLDENPSYFDRLVESIEGDKEDRGRKDGSVFSRDKEEDSNNNVIYLRKKGKKYLIYDNYEFVIQPFFIKISTNYKDAVIYMNDKELGKADNENFNKEYGPFLPGKYTVKSVYTGEYATIETNAEVHLATNNYNSSAKVIHQDLYLDGKYVYINTNYNDGKVIINGENSGLTAEEINVAGLGPVDDTTRLQISKDFPWGTMTSEEIAIGEAGNNPKLYIEPVNPELQNQVMEAVNRFLIDDNMVYMERNIEKYTNLIEPELSTRRDRIDNMIYWEEHFIGHPIGAVYDLNSLKLTSENEGYTVQITGKYNYKKATYYEGREIPEPYDQTNSSRYRLSYDEGNKKWLVYKVESNYYFDDSNTKEYSFEK